MGRDRIDHAMQSDWNSRHRLNIGGLFDEMVAPGGRVRPTRDSVWLNRATNSFPYSHPAWKAQCEETPGAEYLFPAQSEKQANRTSGPLKKIWRATLGRAGVPYFPLYELRHTFATRLSAGGVADHFVSQMLRQGDAGVFKRYSHGKLNMMREALDRLDRRANEHRGVW
ncbi:MAG TPA: tyrosine-type recombinase/integrase [Bryobacteraceae bacterium]|nr:tyrosine-type recombinase/integrase [Bryobacteraceae bacterium]